MLALIAGHKRRDLYMRPTDLLRPVLQDGKRHDHVEWFGSRGNGDHVGKAPMKRSRSESEEGEHEQAQPPADGSTRFSQSQREESRERCSGVVYALDRSAGFRLA